MADAVFSYGATDINFLVCGYIDTPKDDLLEKQFEFEQTNGLCP